MTYTLTVYHGMQKDQQRRAYGNSATRHKAYTTPSAADFDTLDAARQGAVQVLEGRRADAALIETARTLDVGQEVYIDEDTKLVIYAARDGERP